MLVGRGAEVALLGSAYRSAADGAGRLVLISGPAGIGKTTVCAAVAHRCAERGATVLTGGCVPEAGVDIAYAPFISAWRSANQDFGRLLAGLAALGRWCGTAGIRQEGRGTGERIRCLGESTYRRNGRARTARGRRPRRRCR